MKKKLLALVCALVMIFSLASCGLSTPDTVGKVGDFEVSSGLYLLAQFSAYQQAAQLAGTDQDTTDVKAFLTETITTDADSGETAVVQDYVADKTLETLRTFAAIQTPEDAADVLDELIDRYGDPPPSVSDLVNVSLVRVQATAVGVYEVTQKKDTIVLNLEHLDVPMIRGLLVAFNGRVTAGAGSKPYLSVTLHPDEKPLELLQSILKAMAEILNGKDKPQESK